MTTHTDTSDRLLTEVERQQKYLAKLPAEFEFPLFNAAQALESQRRSGYRNTAAAAREIVDNAIEAGDSGGDDLCTRLTSWTVSAYPTRPSIRRAWTCSYPSDGDVGLSRFDLVPPDLIDMDTQEHYRVLENNAYGLVATQSVSKERPEWNLQWKPGDAPAVGAASVVINKGTGGFWWGWM